MKVEINSSITDSTGFIVTLVSLSADIVSTSTGITSGQQIGVMFLPLQYFCHLTYPSPWRDQSVISAVHLLVSYLVIPS